MGVNTGGLQATSNSLMNQQQMLYNKVLAGLGGGYGQFANQSMGLLGPLSGIMGNVLSGPGQMTPQMMQQYMTLANNPQALAQMTGINAPGLMRQATNYMGAPGQTNLAQMYPGAAAQLQPGQSALNMAAPQSMDVFRQMAQQGLNPQFMLNAQNQLQQQFGTSVSDILSRAAPGQNTAGAMQAAQNQLLTGSSNLAGQLAGQSQQVQMQGAQGLIGAGQVLDQNTLARIMGQAQLAGGLDQQTLDMLTQAANMSSAYNRQALGNVGQGAQMGMSGLGASQGLAQMGVGMNQYGMNMMSGLGGQLGQEGFQFANTAAQEAAAAPNPWMVGAQLLGGLGGAYLGGGMGGLFKQGMSGMGGGSNPFGEAMMNAYGTVPGMGGYGMGVGQYGTGFNWAPSYNFGGPF